MTRLFLIFTTVAAALFFAAAVRAADLAELEETAIRSAVDHVAPSVVRIQTIGELSGSGRAVLGAGPSSGLVVSADGYIISSSFNFAREPSTILVELPDGSSHAARLIAQDYNRSLVLLKIDLPEGAAPLPLPEAAADDEVQIGQWAVAVGRAFDAKRPNVSVGIISAVNRVWSKAVQTDAKISPSNYGGPLIDIRGRVLGVLAPLSPQSTQAVAGADWYDSGIGFAIPLTHIYSVLGKLKAGTDLRPGIMGIALKSRDQFGAPAVVAAVPQGCPAQRAGVEADDKIVEANGIPVVNQAQLKHIVSPLYAGDSVRLALLRGDKRVEVEIQLTDELPPFAHPFLGLLPRRDTDFKTGMTVRYVVPGSGADKAGIQPGDRIVSIGEKKIEKRTDLYESLLSAAAGAEIDVEFVRGDKSQTTKVTLGTLPTEIPVELPEAREPAGEANEPEVEVGGIEIAIPEIENKCFAYVPENYHADRSYGVVIWLDRPGQFNQQQLLERWKSYCDQYDLILLVPQAKQSDRWEREEADFIVKALAKLQKTYEVDATRTVVHGYREGGAMAFLLGNAPQVQIHGVAVVESPMPASLTPRPVQPTERTAVYWAYAAQGDTPSLIASQIKRLTEMNYPVTQRRFDGPARYLDDAELNELVRWIDGLDRI